MERPLQNPFILGLTAHNLSVEIHQHSAYQIVLSNDSTFNSTIGVQSYKGISGFIIKPHVIHHCMAENGTLNILNIEPYSTVGLKLSEQFIKGDAVIVFYHPEQVNAFFETDKDTSDIFTLIDTLLATAPHLQYDDRVVKIVEYIKDHSFRQDITPQTFSDLVYLSPSRLAALFKAQTGSSLSKYLLWTRLRQAIYQILSDKNRSLTEIAYDTGFYDLPQLNKYMNEMFGMPPRALKQNSDLIQVY